MMCPIAPTFTSGVDRTGKGVSVRSTLVGILSCPTVMVLGTPPRGSTLILVSPFSSVSTERILTALVAFWNSRWSREGPSLKQKRITPRETTPIIKTAIHFSIADFIGAGLVGGGLFDIINTIYVYKSQVIRFLSGSTKKDD